MGGLLVASIVSGQLITRTGRYKLFPIAGTAIARASGCSCSRALDATTSTGARRAATCSCSASGSGMVMQVLVLAVQNAVAVRELGVATSGATLFRSIGGSLGTAMLGAVFTNRLSHELAATCRCAAAAPAANVGSLDPSAVERLPGGRARRVPRRRSPTRSTSCSSSPPGSWRSRSCSPG